MGMEVLEEKTVARCWRLPVSLAKRLKLAAAMQGQTIEQTVVSLIARHVEDQEAAHQADVRTFVGSDA